MSICTCTWASSNTLLFFFFSGLWMLPLPSFFLFSWVLPLAFSFLFSFLFFFFFWFPGQACPVRCTSSPFFFLFFFCVFFFSLDVIFIFLINLGDYIFLSLFCFNWALFFNKDIWINLYKLTFSISPLFHSQPNKNDKN